MISPCEYINPFALPEDIYGNLKPWEIPSALPELLRLMIPNLGQEFAIHDDIAVHESAFIEKGALIKGPAILCAGCFVGATAYLRGGIYLGEYTSIGPGCELKSSVICNKSAVAHFNFIGDSIIGNRVNFEAGSVVANHFNERAHKTVYISMHGKIVDTGTEKFGAWVGDDSKIGANAVLSPGTLLKPGSVVGRLELVAQVKPA
jgi:NDP-sugar pyrophosphorylase family protein